MKTRISAVLTGIVFLLSPIAHANPDVPLGSISGSSLLIIQIALAEVAKSKIDISKYKISVEEADKTYHVSFNDPSPPPSDVTTTNGRLITEYERRGSSPNMPEFWVEIDKASRKAIGLHYVR
jgi:hypothetical protein